MRYLTPKQTNTHTKSATSAASLQWAPLSITAMAPPPPPDARDSIHTFHWRHTSAVTLGSALAALLLNALFVAWDWSYYRDEFTALAVARLGVTLPVGLVLLAVLRRYGARLEIADRQFILLWFYLIALACFLYVHVRVTRADGPQGIGLSLLLLCVGCAFFGLRPMTAIVFSAIVLLGTMLVHAHVHAFQWPELQASVMVCGAWIGILATMVHDEVMRDHHRLELQVQQAGVVLAPASDNDDADDDADESSAMEENAFLRRRMVLTLKYQKHVYVAQVTMFVAINVVQWWCGFFSAARLRITLLTLLPIDVLTVVYWWVSTNNWLADETGRATERWTRSAGTLRREDFEPGPEGDAAWARHNARTIRALLLRKPVMSLLLALAYITMLAAWPPSDPRGLDDGVPYTGAALVLMLSCTATMQVANQAYLLASWALVMLAYGGLLLSGLLAYATTRQSLADFLALTVGLLLIIVPSILLERLDRRLFRRVYRAAPDMVNRYDPAWVEQTTSFFHVNRDVVSLAQTAVVSRAGTAAAAAAHAPPPERPRLEWLVLVLSCAILVPLLFYTVLTHIMSPARITRWSPFWSNLAYLPLYLLFLARGEPLLAGALTPTIVVSFFYHMSGAYGERALLTPVGAVEYAEWQVADMITASYAVFMGLVYFAARSDTLVFGGSSLLGFFIATLSIVALNQSGSVVVIVVAATIFLHELMRFAVGNEEVHTLASAQRQLARLRSEAQQRLRLSSSAPAPQPAWLQLPPLQKRQAVARKVDDEPPLTSRARDVFTLRRYSLAWLAVSLLCVAVALGSWFWGLSSSDRDSVHSYWHIFGGAAGFALVFARR